MNTQEIKVKIQDESELYTPFDPEQRLLSEDVSDYLIRNYKNMHRKSRERYDIRIISDVPLDEERAKAAVREHWEQERSNVQQEAKVETIREIALAIVGVLLLTVWFFVSQSVESVWMEVLSIMGWVAVWEATSIAIMRRPELYVRRKIYDQASKAEIIIEVKK